MSLHEIGPNRSPSFVRETWFSSRNCVTDRYFQLLDTLDDLLTDPPLTARVGKPARKALPPLVGRAAGRVERAALAVADDWTPQARDRGLHEVRKSAKRARYAAETAAPLAGDAAAALADRMEALQDVLGEHQDSVASRALLLELNAAAQASGEVGFTYGLLYAQERTRTDKARRAYERALSRASTRKARQWTLCPPPGRDGPQECLALMSSQMTP